ncbi:PREDICTED: UPF0598 protein CG30010 [Wasmannia auropunctata]|uniref:UPF0598 protein CG30010 n=1 Tax=Wasmannia auropunctata TaxID=64793 RepID=UPI0005F01D1A|nr:PREDICTED: UPF0598 protein CG30010 [Wasmannia auropunctata]XP_011685910.1 PREDICTED: UPF0598 protein CG30010 [Wasmannia auropunctata]XP_011685911.1 PREDICTED: UPF0598 protein CG30010 [Wasmannia auropunctata]
MTSVLRMRAAFVASRRFPSPKTLGRSYATYVQGQSPEPRVREYFYYIDHQGMLFLDDVRIRNFTSCFKDKKFLAFFFKRLRKNTIGRYTDDFPFLSICGVERNFVRCDDLPLVFTKVIRKRDVETGAEEDWFSYAHADDLLMVPFDPQRLFMNVKTGRVYHPAPEKAGGIGLVRSNLAIEFSASFNFENGEGNPPTHFAWCDK